ncbi:MAG: ABC transporter permease, partial [Bryobacteraceae bacterium]
MILLRLLSWPYARKHRLRSLLTIAGIALGVAVFVAMHTANQAVLDAFNDMVARIAGKTELQVTSGPTGFDEQALERVQALAEVRAAAPVIEAVVDSGLPGQGNLLVLAVDMTGDSSLRDYDLEGDEDIVDDPLVFLAQPDSLIVTREFAARNGLRAGSILPVDTMDGPKRFTIRGLLKPSGLASAVGANLAIMDIYAAQKVFGRGRRFDRIDLAAAEGVTLAQCRAAVEKALGPGFEVEPPSSRGQQFESLLAVYTAAMGLSSAFSLFIGMFIIYNSFAIAVTQRRPEIGILRALGATQGQVRALFLGESVVAGAAGSALGIAAGVAMAKGLAGYVATLLESIYGVTGRPREVAPQPELLALALALGVVASVVAALVPSRNAARVDPVRALQKGKYQVIGAGESRFRRIAALVCAIASLACRFAGGAKWSFYTGYLLMILACLLLTPMLALGVARLLRPLLRWLRPVEGALAADSLIQAPRRTSATVAALMLSLAVTVSLSGVALAGYDSIREWIDSTLNPDLFVSASKDLVDRSFQFPAAVGGRIREVEAVDEVQNVRTFNLRVRKRPVTIVAVEMDRVAARTGARKVIAGDFAEMHRLTAAGQGVVA